MYQVLQKFLGRFFAELSYTYGTGFSNTGLTSIEVRRGGQLISTTICPIENSELTAS